MVELPTMIVSRTLEDASERDQVVPADVHVL
jgi:hypothetical protein